MIILTVGVNFKNFHERKILYTGGGEELKLTPAIKEYIPVKEIEDLHPIRNSNSFYAIIQLFAEERHPRY